MSESRISLKELQELIGLTISENLERHYWVSAEISEININYSGHCYLELIEKETADSDIAARIRALIWNRKARFLLPYFKTSAGIDLNKGISVLLKGKVEYHAVYGISFVIEDIDPSYTAGDLAIKRNRIIESLRTEGVFDMNKELALPAHPGRIAVISSGEAAGFGDLKNQLLNNPHDFKYKIDLFKAVMQGSETERSVLDALGRISESISSYDLVAIVRGGGSQADLSWFDNYEIAYFITQFPLPLISGIGHDKDVSVTDLVAHTSCKTPTAVANLIIDLSLETERYLYSLGRDIIGLAKERVRQTETTINTLAKRLGSLSRLNILAKKTLMANREEMLRSAARYFLKEKSLRLAGISSRFRSEPARMLVNAANRIENIDRAISYLSPEMVLKRGYSITLKNGKSLKSTDTLKKGDRLKTILHSGNIDSEIFDIKE